MKGKPSRLWERIRGARRRTKVLAGVLALAVVPAMLLIGNASNPRTRHFLRWWQGTESDRAALITSQLDGCPGAPFVLPAEGFIGLLYGDPRGPYSRRRPHQGIDIFSPTAPGETAVYAAYDGYVTREKTWVSTVIQRVPSDPLQPDRQIWLYYTHMAPADGNGDYISPAFPPGASEIFVEQGTLLGYTGNYGGSRPVGTHLHFSIIQDNGLGGYSNELDFANSIDSSAYLGMAVNYACQEGPPTCSAAPVCLQSVVP